MTQSLREHFGQYRQPGKPATLGICAPGKHVYGDGWYVTVPLDADLEDTTIYPSEWEGQSIHYEKTSMPKALR